MVANRAKLELRMNYLVIRQDVLHKVHLSEIGMVIVESTQVSITSALLCELVKRKIKIIFCDEKRNPLSEIVGYHDCHDSSLKIKQQINWKPHTKNMVWTEIVTEKIKNQQRLLKKLGIIDAERLEIYAESVHPGDPTNREGHAAKVYFNALFGMRFSRSEENPINAGLNYGYSILLSMVNREIAAAGYLTQLGLSHDNQFNPFNFGSDLMEPLRPIIDSHIVENPPTEFGKEEKQQLTNIINKEVIISGKTQILSNAIKIYCKSVFDALNESDMKLIRFCRDEL